MVSKKHDIILRNKHTKNRFNIWIRTISLILLIAFLWHDIIWAYPDIESIKATLQVQTLCSNPGSHHRAIGELLQEKLEHPCPVHVSDIQARLHADPELWSWIDTVARKRGFLRFEEDPTRPGEVRFYFEGGTCIRYYNPQIHRPYAGYGHVALNRPTEIGS